MALLSNASFITPPSGLTNPVSQPNASGAKTQTMTASSDHARRLALHRAKRCHQQGLFAYHRGQFTQALVEFERACEIAAQNEDHALYVETCTHVLRILAEREEFSKIGKIESSIVKIMESTELRDKLKLKSKAMYVLGICGCYEGTRHDLAMNRFREAIDFAVSSGDKESLAAPLYGAATLLYARQHFDEAMRELDRLQILLTCLQLPELGAASLLLRSMILKKRGDFTGALESAWSSYDMLKFHPQLVLYPHILCTIGTLCHLKNDPRSARLYLDLADRSVKRDEFPRIARLVDEALAALGSSHVEKMDLVFDLRTGILTERVKGEIRFEGQFVLRDLLRVFLENPGRIFTKEELAREVWREEYSPRVHDNKIYVTIKRLRKLLECEVSKTEYILRAKTGYFLNPKARVLIENHGLTDENHVSSDENHPTVPGTQPPGPNLENNS